MKRDEKYAILIFVALMGIGFLIAEIRERRLVKNFKVTEGIVTEVQHLRNSGRTIFLTYKFRVSGNWYGAKEGLSCDPGRVEDIEYLMKGRQVKVVYRYGNPNNSRILLTKGAFNKFKLPVTGYDSVVVSQVCSICCDN